MFFIKTGFLKLLFAVLGGVLLATGAQAQSLTPPPLAPPAQARTR